MTFVKEWEGKRYSGEGIEIRAGTLQWGFAVQEKDWAELQIQQENMGI